jgi:tetratricopeptide (TPR) repeat protein
MEHKQAFVVGANQASDNGVVKIDLTAVMKAAAHETDLNGPYHRLIGNAFSLQAQVEAATAEVNANNLAHAEDEWEAARGAARSALDAYNALNNQELRYRNELQKAIDERTAAIRHLNALKEAKPSPALFPSADEISRWESGVSAAQKTVDEKVEAFTDASQSIQLYYSELNQLGAVLNAASEKEKALRLKLNALKGVANTAPDSNTGLKQRIA